jgi:spore maturation protein CgeB
LRILIACQNEEFTSGSFCRQAFEALGHKTLTFDLKVQGDSGGLLASKKKRVNAGLVEAVSEFRPDLLFVTGGLEILPETVGAVRKGGVVTANWFPSDPYEFEESKKIAPSYDFYFTSDSALISAYKEVGQKNIHFLPFCCEPHFHKKVQLTEEEKKKYSAEISFVGQCNKPRQKLLETLADFDLKVFGAGWVKRVKKGSPLYGKVFDPVYPAELPKVYSASAIVLNIHFWFGCFTHGVNVRLFEAAGCAACQICDFQEQIPQLFLPEKEVIIFRTESELVQLAQRLVPARDSASEIGAHAQARAYRDHTYEIRMREVLDICGG